MEDSVHSFLTYGLRALFLWGTFLILLSEKFFLLGRIETV